MKWENIAARIDDGARNLAFVTKPMGSTFRVYNYSGNSTVNSMLCLFDVWGKKASCPKMYKDKFEYQGYELPTEIYDFFKTEATHLAFDRLGVALFLEEELENEDTKYPVEMCNG